MTRRMPGVLGLLAVAAVGAGVVTGAARLPAAGRSAVVAAEPLPRSLSAPSLVCPGPETLLVPDGGEAVRPGAAVQVRALVGASPAAATARLKLLGRATDGTTAPVGGDPAPTTGRTLSLKSHPQGPALGTLAATGLGPAVLKLDQAGAGRATGAPAPAIAAVQSTLARTGSLRGLAATACSAARPDSWLIGGSTRAGERLRLLLANPAAAPAVVDVDVHGPDGRVSAPSGDGVVVPAGGEVPIYIDALAPGLDRVAVHVTTRSGRIRATLHDSLLRGVTPGGADDVPVAAGPARRQVVPGVSLVNGYGKTAGDPTAAGSTSVRVAVPGSEEAVVRVSLLDSDGSVDLPGTAVVTVPGGGVADVPIAGVASGVYTAVVDADVPVVAGAQIGRAGSRDAEFGWAAGASRLTGDSYAVLPPGTRSTLSLAAVKGTGGLVLTAVHADGTLAPPTDVGVPDSTSVAEQLPDDAVAVRISGLTGGAVVGAIVAGATDPGGTLLSVLPIEPAATAREPASAVADSRLGLR